MEILHTIKIPALSGKKTIADSELFAYKDSDFKKLNKVGKKTKATNISVYEMDKDGTFTDIFGSLSNETDKLALTQEQILYFVENHKDKLRQDGWATFFLYKEGDDFFVAGVHLLSSGPYVYQYPLSCGNVWGAEVRHRFVVPQLTSSPSAEPLKLRDSDTLNSAIKLVKEAGYKIYKEI